MMHGATPSPSPLDRGHELAVVAALDTVATAIRPLGYGRWSLAHATGSMHAGTAWIDDGWLCLDTTPEPPLDAAWRLLEWNATLADGVRFVIPPGSVALHVRADVALDEDVDVARRVIGMWAGIEAAIALVHGAQAGPVPSRLPSDAALVTLCRETGWRQTVRGSDAVAIELDVPGEFRQALVERRADGALAASVAVAEATAVEACRRALALLLLRTSGAVRMVRAAADVGARLEVVPASARADELAHGLAALSVACRLAASEAAVLHADEAVARIYLRQWNDAVAHRAT